MSGPLSTSTTAPKAARYQWLLFDADGTLFDYDRAEALALEKTFAHLNLLFTPQVVDVYRPINAGLWQRFEAGQIAPAHLRTQRFADLFAALGLAADAEHFSRLYLASLAEEGVLFPGAEAVVRRLAGLYHLAIITNGLAEVQHSRLDRSSIKDCFEVLAISEELGAAKPAPRFFELLFARLGGVSKPAVLVIGDSLSSDIQGGINFGIDTCWYNPAHLPSDPARPATYSIARLEELLPLLEAA
jgi:2-haloacid dehalogenase